MLRFCLMFDCQDCCWMSWRDFQKAIKCNYYLIILENSFLKSQIYDKLVTMWLSYHFFVTKGLFNFCRCIPFRITRIYVSWKFQLPKWKIDHFVTKNCFLTSSNVHNTASYLWTCPGMIPEKVTWVWFPARINTVYGKHHQLMIYIKKFLIKHRYLP